METVISTRDAAPASRSRHWHEAIASTYFPLDLSFRNAATFEGELRNWTLGEVSLSRLTSAALLYRRLPKHFAGVRGEDFLVTIPARAEVHFAQCGKEVRCNPGAFFLERNHEPYEFSHAEAADLWVLKIDASVLGGRVRAPDRFCGTAFDAANGASGLLVDVLHLIPGRFAAMTEELRAMVGRQIVELLALALQADARTLASAGSSSVRTAHLMRIESHVRRHLHDPGMDPEAVARACGISIRYLHQLLRDTDQTLGRWIRDQRLAACSEDLKHPGNRETIAAIAYRRGFSGQAQFSRVFRERFGLSPKEFREQHRLRRSRDLA
jgi:AraC-like DNA-binding protein